MATIAGLLTSPWLLAAIVAIVVLIVAVFASGALRRDAFEADLGIAALCAMKWQDFAGLVGTWLAGRGLQRSTTERKLGDGGFDLLLERGTSSYLVICRNASQQQVTMQHVGDLQRTMQHEDAEGGLIVSCGAADTAALVEQARQRGIEVVAGHALWRQIRELIPYDVRDDAEAGAERKRRQRWMVSVVAALVAGVATWFAATLLQSAPDDGASATVPVSRPAPRPAAATAPPAPATTTGTPAQMPDATLTEAQLETRRATAAMDVRSIPGLDDAVWSTKSTLVITLPAGTTTVADTLVSDVCRILLQYEEQRYSRLQLEIPAAPGTGGPDGAAPPQVRWRQCR